MIKSNFAKFEGIQKAHKVTSASAVKYGGVLESLALATFGNHIGSEVTLPELETALTAQLGGFVFTSPEEIAGVEKIGQTKADFTLVVNGVKLDGHKLDSAFKGNWKKFTQLNLPKLKNWKKCQLSLLTQSSKPKKLLKTSGLHPSLPRNQLGI